MSHGTDPDVAHNSDQALACESEWFSKSASLAATPLTRDDLVLANAVSSQIEHIITWQKHRQTILDDWELKRHVKAGFRSLFHGPSGTGKTLTATMLGTAVESEVHRINIAMLISKYIGETEKNIARVFDRAQLENWVLLFDEADALFGKRTEVTSSHDRYANLEVSYLLQCIEDYSGLVILETSMPDNIDEAFVRRCQSQIYFPMPDANERLRLWRGVVGDKCKLGDDVDLERFAAKYELSGGSIVNVVQFAAINALRMDRSFLSADDLVKGVRSEFGKEGRTT